MFCPSEHNRLHSLAHKADLILCFSGPTLAMTFSAKISGVHRFWPRNHWTWSFFVWFDLIIDRAGVDLALGPDLNPDPNLNPNSNLPIAASNFIYLYLKVQPGPKWLNLYCSSICQVLRWDRKRKRGPVVCCLQALNVINHHGIMQITFTLLYCLLCAR